MTRVRCNHSETDLDPAQLDDGCPACWLERARVAEAQMQTLREALLDVAHGCDSLAGAIVVAEQALATTGKEPTKEPHPDDLPVNSVGTCSRCGYYGPGPWHPCTNPPKRDKEKC